MADITYVVTTGRENWRVTGMDSMICSVPDQVRHLFKPGQPMATGLITLLDRMLRDVSNDGADSLGETLHHAKWILTNDPVEVTARGLLHECSSCQAGVDQALAYLREHPDQLMMVGTLYWAGPA